MPPPPSIALIAIFCLAVTARAEDKPSPAVKRILDKAVGKVRANRQDFDKANKKPLDEARAELQELAKKLVDDGKADEATTVLAQVKTLDGDVMRMANAPALVSGGAGPQKPLLERLEGKWGNPNISWTTVIDASGTVCELDSSGRIVNQGKITQQGTDVGEVILSNGYKLQLRPAGDDALAVLVWTPKGKLHAEGRCLMRMK